MRTFLVACLDLVACAPAEPACARFAALASSERARRAAPAGGTGALDAGDDLAWRVQEVVDYWQ